MNRFLLLSTIMLCMLLPTLASAANDQVRFTLIAEIEVEATNEKGEKIWVRQPAELVTPGTVIIYTGKFDNLGKEPVENIKATNPIPDGTAYISGSALAKDALITFSVDAGNSFANENALVITEADGSKRAAKPEDITHIQFHLTNPIAPGASGQAEFRARLL